MKTKIDEGKDYNIFKQLYIIIYKKTKNKKELECQIL